VLRGPNRPLPSTAWLLWVILITGCQVSQDFGSADPTDLSGQAPVTDAPHPDCTDDANSIDETPISGSYAAYASLGFNRFASVVSDNGGVIPIFAQDEVSYTQLLRARNILRFFLTNVADSKWGNDKSDVGNMMASNGAALMMPNGAHEEGNEPNLPAQPLYADETPADGSTWFMENDFEHRDAAFEEIFHLVHDMGIGTFAPGARPEYQQDLDAEARLAIADGRWGIPVEPEVQDWLDELEAEGSLAQEYIASVIDSYYGLWGPWNEGEGGMWGVYIAKTRDEVSALDPEGKTLLEQFLPPYIGTEIILDPTLEQDFSLSFDPEKPYTHKSQYFLHVSLSGTASINLIGNESDNTLRGNEGDNILDGLGGEDTAVFCNSITEYTVSADGEVTVVDGPSGLDQLRNMEWAHFSEGRYAISDLR
jgi:hypothetical protein